MNKTRGWVTRIFLFNPGLICLLDWYFFLPDKNNFRSVRRNWKADPIMRIIQYILPWPVTCFSWTWLTEEFLFCDAPRFLIVRPRQVCKLQHLSYPWLLEWYGSTLWGRSYAHLHFVIWKLEIFHRTHILLNIYSHPLLQLVAGFLTITRLEVSMG